VSAWVSSSVLNGTGRVCSGDDRDYADNPSKRSAEDGLSMSLLHQLKNTGKTGARIGAACGTSKMRRRRMSMGVVTHFSASSLLNSS
jgi:hypothetical protein